MTRQHAILLVDADAELRSVLRSSLTGAGFGAAEAGSMGEANRHLSNGTPFRAMILDVVLPDGEGRDFCEEIKGEGVSAPNPAADRAPGRV